LDVVSAAPSRHPREVRAWLEQQPSLEELQAAYPRDWEAVQRELAEIVPRGDREELTRYVASLARGGGGARAAGRRRGLADVSSEIRRHMAVEAIKQLSLQAATGVTEGRVRFNLVNGKVAQRLLFDGGGFKRKPVSMFWFKTLWPLLWQRRYLMPLVAKKGIYCFYSKPLVTELAALIGDRSALEIAAGDGTLTRFLRDADVDITATDDHSWRDVSFPEWVVKEDAKLSLKTRKPQVVVCSWPPANNDFERAVFATKSVELYIVVGSRHQFAAGNWATYEQQTAFELEESLELSRLVLPPELDAAVYLFRRRV
jgi:hypothetical protein